MTEPLTLPDASQARSGTLTGRHGPSTRPNGVEARAIADTVEAATTEDADVAKLRDAVRELLEERASSVPFHGWSHTEFVRKKAVEFARARGADIRIVEAAALVHDLNYVVEPNSGPAAGCPMRMRLLAGSGFSADEIETIERMIEDAHTANRQRHVDVATACLSDADTLFKALPITPVLFAHLYLAENDITVAHLARKIVGEQVEKLEGNYYFYDQRLTDRYGYWAEANLGLWRAIHDALGDPDVQSLVADVSDGSSRRTPLVTGRGSAHHPR